MNNYDSKIVITSEALIATWWQHTLIEELVVGMTWRRLNV